jgi:hypothetical protein
MSLPRTRESHWTSASKDTIPQTSSPEPINRMMIMCFAMRQCDLGLTIVGGVQENPDPYF